MEENMEDEGIVTSETARGSPTNEVVEETSETPEEAESE